MTTIERIVWEARQRAEDKIFKSLVFTLNESQKLQLDQLLDINSTYSMTPLAWLREVPGQSSLDALLKVIQRLQVIQSLQLHVDSKEIHPNRILQLARLGSKYEPRSFRNPLAYNIRVLSAGPLSKILSYEDIRYYKRNFRIKYFTAFKIKAIFW